VIGPREQEALGHLYDALADVSDAMVAVNRARSALPTVWSDRMLRELAGAARTIEDQIRSVTEDPSAGVIL